MIIVYVDTDVAGVAQVGCPDVVLSIVMDVPVKMNKTILVISAPKHQRIMAEDQTFVAHNSQGRQRYFTANAGKVLYDPLNRPAVPFLKG